MIGYNEILELELEIKKFQKIVNNNSLTLEEILKRTLFFQDSLKEINKKNEHYKDVFMFDLLLCLNSIFDKKKRNFYFYYRSFIENYIRILINLEDKDSLGVIKLFKKLKEEKIEEDDYNFLEFNYSEACNYVHSNILANLKISRYYNEILKDTLEESEQEELLQLLLNLLNMMIKNYIKKYIGEIENNYFRTKQKLSFFIGEDNFKIFKEKIKLLDEK